MGKIIKRPTKVVEEVLRKPHSRCLHCGKPLKAGDTTVACYAKNGDVRARFCSRQCQEEKRDEILNDVLGIIKE